MPELPTNPTPEGDDGAASDGNGGGGHRKPSLPRTTATFRMLQARTNISELKLSEEVVRDAIALQGQRLGNDDRQSERNYGDRKETRRLSFALAIIALIAVVAIIVFLVIYNEGGLLGYILSGIGGLIAGAFGGYGYANRPR